MKSEFYFVPMHNQHSHVFELIKKCTVSALPFDLLNTGKSQKDRVSLVKIRRAAAPRVIFIDGLY